MPEVAESKTIGTIVGQCHQAVSAIEERLCTIRVPPDQPGAPTEKELEHTPTNTVEELEADRKAVQSLLHRLHNLENHAAAIQESMKVLV